MCGLFGVAGDLSQKDCDVFKDLMLASQTRGSDATGIAVYRKWDKKAEIHKMAVPSSAFLDMRRVDNLISPQYDLLMGHTRKATGAWNSRTNPRDAHPFQCGDIIGAHNGVIPHAALNNLKHNIKDAIDSENVIYNISAEGLDGTIPNIWGAYALSLLDVENKKLGFVRNTQRTLSFMYSKSKKTIYWASEPLMLQWAVERHNISCTTDVPLMLKEDVFAEFTFDSKVEIVDTVAFRELVGGKEPEKKTYTPPQQGGYYRAPGTTTQMTRGSGPTSVSNKPNSPLDTALTAVKRMEAELIKFNFADRNNWTKKEKNKFNTLIIGIQNIYDQVASGHITSTNVAAITDVTESEEQLDLPLTGKRLAKHLLESHACCFCCTSDVADADLGKCAVSKDKQAVLCPTCAQDESLLHLGEASIVDPRPFVPDTILLN